MKLLTFVCLLIGLLIGCGEVNNSLESVPKYKIESIGQINDYQWYSTNDYYINNNYVKFVDLNTGKEVTLVGHFRIYAQ